MVQKIKWGRIKEFSIGIFEKRAEKKVRQLGIQIHERKWGKAKIKVKFKIHIKNKKSKRRRGRRKPIK